MENQKKNQPATESVRTVGEGKTTTRVQLELAAHHMDILRRLQEKFDATSYADVVKRLLRLGDIITADDVVVEIHDKDDPTKVRRIMII